MGDIFGMNKEICEMNIIGPRCRERFVPLLQPGPLSRLGVGLAGVSDLRGRYCMSRPHSALSVILGTLAGRAKLTTNTETRFLKPGDLLIAPAPLTHRYELVRSGNWKIVWFNIPHEIPCDKILVLKVNYLDRMAQEYNDIIEEAAVGSFLSMDARLAKENYLAVLLQRILHFEKHEQQSVHETCLRNLWSAVMDHPAKKRRLEELAEIAGYSAGHLNRICRQYYGRSAVHHLTRLRMDYGAQLFSQRVLKVQTVARICGYENQFAFSVAFKRQFGVSPDRYRKDHGS
jgi:AraC-like DNA-binding protein